MEILGARLKILRNEAGKTQQGMADFLGCQVRHYQLIEGGLFRRVGGLSSGADGEPGDQPLTRAGETEVFPAVLVPAFTQEAGPACHSRTCDVPQGRAKAEGIP